MKAEESEEMGRAERAVSSRFAHSITIRIPSISPSTLAKNLVSSMARVLRLSLRSSSPWEIKGAEVRFA